MEFGIILVGYPNLIKDSVIQGHVILIYFTKLILKSNFAAARVEGLKVHMAHVYPFFSSQMLPGTVSFTPINLILDKWAVSLDYSPFSNLQGHISERSHHLLFFRCVSHTWRFSWGLKKLSKSAVGVWSFSSHGNILDSECSWRLRGNLTLPAWGAPATRMGHADWGFLVCYSENIFLKQLVYSQGTENAVWQQNLDSLLMIITLEVLA